PGSRATHGAAPRGKRGTIADGVGVAPVGEGVERGGCLRATAYRLPFLGGLAMWIIEIAIGLGSALALVAAYLLTCIRVLNEYERGVIFRLGRAIPKPEGPGLILVFWPVDRMMRVDLRTITKVI